MLQNLKIGNILENPTRFSSASSKADLKPNIYWAIVKGQSTVCATKHFVTLRQHSASSGPCHSLFLKIQTITND